MTDEAGKGADDQYRELLSELRVALPGVQVLLAVLLTVPFDSRFERLPPFDRVLFGCGILGAGVACVLLIAPTIQHRLTWRTGVRDMERLVVVANREVIAGMAAMAVSIALAVYVVVDLIAQLAIAGAVGAALALLMAWLWAVEPLRARAPRDDARRRILAAQTEGPGGTPGRTP
jgi:hypothetical protein